METRMRAAEEQVEAATHALLRGAAPGQALAALAFARGANGCWRRLLLLVLGVLPAEEDAILRLVSDFDGTSREAALALDPHLRVALEALLERAWRPVHAQLITHLQTVDALPSTGARGNEPREPD